MALKLLWPVAAVGGRTESPLAARGSGTTSRRTTADAVTVRASAEFVRLRLVAPHTLSVLGAAGVPERPSAERSARLIALQKYRSYAVWCCRPGDLMTVSPLIVVCHQ